MTSSLAISLIPAEAPLALCRDSWLEVICRTLRGRPSTGTRKSIGSRLPLGMLSVPSYKGKVMRFREPIILCCPLLAGWLPCNGKVETVDPSLVPSTTRFEPGMLEAGDWPRLLNEGVALCCILNSSSLVVAVRPAGKSNTLVGRGTAEYLGDGTIVATAVGLAPLVLTDCEALPKVGAAFMVTGTVLFRDA